MKVVKEHINEFKRGLEPKVAMNTGLISQLQKYAEETWGYADDFKNSYDDILYRLIGYETPNLSDDQKNVFIDWLLKQVDVHSLDENLIDGLHDMEWDLVPYFKKLPDGNFAITKTDNGYILETPEWDYFEDYFMRRTRDYSNYIKALLSGDAIEYFQYDYSDVWENDLDIDVLEYHDPKGMGDILEALQKINFADKEKTINQFFKGKTSCPIFNFIWTQADDNQPGFEKLKRAIMQAGSQTIEAGNEYEAFKDLTKQIADHFDMEYLKNSVSLKFKISKTGLNKFIYAYYIDDAKINYVTKEVYGDFDIETFHDCFENALNT